MAISVSFNGVVYSIPETGEESWGENVTSFLVAIPSGALQKSGGSFTLTADVNFGATFGLLSRYFSARTASPSTVGVLRLAVTDSIGWKNNSGGGNLLLGVNASDQLVFNGTSIISNAITALTGDVTATGPGSVAATIAANAVTNAKFRQSAALSLVGNATNATANVADISAGTDHFALVRSGTTLTFALLVNANIDAAAAIAYSKLALTGSIVNADINASAAIAYSKLNLSASIVNADISASAAIAYSKLNLSLSIVNADVNASAAIAYSKLAALTISRALVSDGSGIVSVSAVTSTQIGFLGSVASTVLGQSDSGTFTNKTIAAGSNTITGLTNTNLSGSAAITNANLATMVTATVKGNISGSTATPSDVSLVSAATASTVMLRDTNANVSANNVATNYATTATAATTTTLTVASAKNQYFTGVTTQSCVLPDATTLPQTGFQFYIVNLSSGAVTIKDAGGSTVQVLAASSFAFVTAKSIASSNGSWDVQYATNNAGGGTVTSVNVAGAKGLSFTGGPVTTSGTITAVLTGPTIQILTSGSGATYTLPAGCLYIDVEVQGAGGGGGGSGSSGGGTGGTGGDSSFGSITAHGGTGGGPSANDGGGGGTATGGDINVTGQKGAPGGGAAGTTTASPNISMGGDSMLGLGGQSTFNTQAGVAATGYGGGGGGGGANSTTASSAGGGGGGAYARKLISSPSATYTYSVSNTGGTLGSAGTSGQAGTAGSPGVIIVREYYQ